MLVRAIAGQLPIVLASDLSTGPRRHDHASTRARAANPECVIADVAHSRNGG